MAVLFIAIIDTSMAEGSTLNPIVATQKPPISESNSTNRRSLTVAERARWDRLSASDGQMKQKPTSNPHTHPGVCLSSKTAATQMKPTASPMARGKKARTAKEGPGLVATADKFKRISFWQPAEHSI